MDPGSPFGRPGRPLVWDIGAEAMTAELPFEEDRAGRAGEPSLVVDVGRL